ncbi:hypothetical protein N9L19_01100 [bacterium]|nr:hypothetical protein [bacterium]
MMRELAGRGLPTRVAIIELRADWAELSKCSWVPLWEHALSPCHVCGASLHRLYEFQGWTLSDALFHVYGPAKSNAECGRPQTIILVCDEDVRMLVTQPLVFKKRIRGRALVRNIPELTGNMSGESSKTYRLEPGSYLK